MCWSVLLIKVHRLGIGLWHGQCYRHWICQIIAGSVLAHFKSSIIVLRVLLKGGIVVDTHVVLTSVRVFEPFFWSLINLVTSSIVLMGKRICKKGKGNAPPKPPSGNRDDEEVAERQVFKSMRLAKSSPPTNLVLANDNSNTAMVASENVEEKNSKESNHDLFLLISLMCKTRTFLQ